jgi:hypothetical protein
MSSCANGGATWAATFRLVGDRDPQVPQISLFSAPPRNRLDQAVFGVWNSNPGHGESTILHSYAANLTEQFVALSSPGNRFIGLAQEHIKPVQMNQPRLRALTPADLAFEVVTGVKHVKRHVRRHGGLI